MKLRRREPVTELYRALQLAGDLLRQLQDLASQPEDAEPCIECGRGDPLKRIKALSQETSRLTGALNRAARGLTWLLEQERARPREFEDYRRAVASLAEDLSAEQRATLVEVLMPQAQGSA